MTEHKLPTLPYAYDALEPYIDAPTMEIHYTKHHQAYVNNLNAAIDKHKEFGDLTTENLIKSLDKLPEDIRTTVRNHGGGHFNHTFFWKIMKPPSGGDPPVGEPAGPLAEVIQKTFGDFAKFKDEFTKAAVSRFGSGWAWLTLTNFGGLEVYSTPNQDSPVMEGKFPLLGLDVWEHAYYLKYRSRRPEYVQNWWPVVNWEKAAENYTLALSAIKPNA